LRTRGTGLEEEDENFGSPRSDLGCQGRRREGEGTQPREKHGEMGSRSVILLFPPVKQRPPFNGSRQSKRKPDGDHRVRRVLRGGRKVQRKAPQDLQGNRIKVAEPVASKKIRKERGSDLGLGGERTKRLRKPYETGDGGYRWSRENQALGSYHPSSVCDPKRRRLVRGHRPQVRIGTRKRGWVRSSSAADPISADRKCAGRRAGHNEKLISR
jgi:hypothetical protein